MKPHPRIRKTIKWGGAAVTVLLVGVWVWSAWWYAEAWIGQGWSVGLVSGQVQAAKQYPVALWSRKISTVNRSQEVNLRIDGYWTRTGRSIFVGVPIWPLFMVTGFATLLAWRADAAARRGDCAHLCAKCGYDRTGIVEDAKCPECGVGPASG